jgi:hypothetical protein
MKKVEEVKVASEYNPIRNESEKMLRISPIYTKFFGYHSATVCRSYDQAKIRRRLTFVNPVIDGF